MNNAIFGCEYYFPVFSKQLVMARRSLSGWTGLRPPQAHPPLHWGIACLIAVQMHNMGHVGAGVAVLVGFDGYLRVSEIADVRASDVHEVEEDVRGYTRILVNLREKTKTGRNQSFLIRRSAVAGLLVCWKEYVVARTGDPAAKLFPGTVQFRHLFHLAQEELGWGEDGRVLRTGRPRRWLQHKRSMCQWQLRPDAGRDGRLGLLP